MAREVVDMLFEVGGIALKLSDSHSTYAPSDDTELLTLSALSLVPEGASVLEVGTGSGAVILTLAKSKKNLGALMALDIEKDAVETARANAQANGISSVKFLQSDLFSALPSTSYFNLILFNPPYLPTAKCDKVNGPLNSALDGGRDGLKTVRRFLAQASKHLQPGGKILMVVSSLQPKDKLEALLGKNRLAHHPLASKSFFFESLEIWELTRTL